MKALGEKKEKRYDFLTAEELGEQLRISQNTIYFLAKKGKIPSAFKIGKHWRFRKDMIMKWIEKETASKS